MLEKKRTEELAALQRQKEEIEKQTTVRIGSDRFQSQTDGVENALKAATVGLVKLEDFQRIKSGLEEQAARERELGPGKKPVNTKKRKDREKGKVKLSFGDEEEEGADEEAGNGSTNGEANGGDAPEAPAEANGDGEGQFWVTMDVAIRNIRKPVAKMNFWPSKGLETFVAVRTLAFRGREPTMALLRAVIDGDGSI